jgi:hypothetical protein
MTLNQLNIGQIFTDRYIYYHSGDLKVKTNSFFINIFQEVHNLENSSRLECLKHEKVISILV